MRYLIHGDNLIESRAYLTRLINTHSGEKNHDVIRLDGRKLDETQVIQALESTSLFGTGRLVIIERLFQHSSKKIKKAVSAYVNRIDFDGVSIILWEDRQLTPTQLKPFLTFDIKVFKSSPAIFKFLDALVPGNTAACLTFLSQVLHTDAPELVLFMLARHTRSLLLISAHQFKGPSWQQQKLKKQLAALTLDKVLNLHAQLTHLDWRSKTGRSAFDLPGELELLVTTTLT